MLKKLFLLSTILILFVAGCSDEKTIEKRTELSIDVLQSEISKLDGVYDVCIYTEENDTNGLLHKEGGYTDALSFSIEGIEDYCEDCVNSCDRGTSGGGTIEIFENENDAIKRNEYLSVFDGSVISSGLHTQVDNVIIRISSELTASEQQEWEEKILKIINANN